MANNLLIPVTFLFGRDAGDNVSPVAGEVSPVPYAPFSFATGMYPGDTSRALPGQPPDTVGQQPAAMLDALQKLNARGGVYEIDTGGEPIEISRATFATVLLIEARGPGQSIEGAVFIDPSDIGNGPAQFPNDATQLTADTVLTAPNVFIRPSARMRGVISLQDDTDLTPMPVQNEVELPVSVEVVLDVPVYSGWTFMIDGQVTAGLIQHPLTSGGTPVPITRPRDVWNRVIVQAIQQANASDNVGSLQIYANTGSAVAARGRITRLDQLDYARFGGFFDAFGDPIDTKPLYPGPS